MRGYLLKLFKTHDFEWSRDSKPNYENLFS